MNVGVVEWLELPPPPLLLLLLLVSVKVNWCGAGAGCAAAGLGLSLLLLAELLLLLRLLLGTMFLYVRSLVLRRCRILGARPFLMGWGKLLRPRDLVLGPGVSGVAAGVVLWAEWKLESSELGANGEVLRRRRSWRRSVAGVGGVTGVILGEGRSQYGV